MSKHGGGGRYNVILELKGEQKIIFYEKEKERKKEIKKKYMYEKTKTKKCEYE
jgi:hypothetical protein